MADKRTQKKKTAGKARAGKSTVIDFTLKKKDGIGEITFNGDLTVQHAVTLKDVLLKALKQAKQVMVRAGTNATVTLPVLQLLCSAHRSALQRKKDLRLAQVSKGIAALIDAAGYSHCKDCAIGRSSNCLWILGRNGA